VAAALKVAAVRSRAARPAAGDLVAEAAAFPADPRVAAAPEAAVGQFRAARPALEGPVAGAAAFPEVRPEAAVPGAAEVVCRASVASRFLDQRSPGTRAALAYRDLRQSVRWGGIAKSASLYMTSAADERVGRDIRGHHRARGNDRS